MHSYHFLPLISKPTRLPANNHQNASLLDHIWFNRLNSHSSGIDLFDFTDHLPTFVNIPSLNIKLNNKIKVQFRCEDDVGKLRFNRLLSEFDWNLVVNNDVDIYTQAFIDKINEFYVKSFPLKTKYVSCKQHANPWLNKNISKLIKLKSLYFNMYKRGIISKEENNSYKNKANSIISKAKAKYFKNKFYHCRNDIKKTWQNLKYFTGSSVSRDVENIKFHGETLSDKKLICEAFNSYFCGVGESVENSIPVTEVDPLSYMPQPLVDSLFLFPVTSSECNNIIKNLKNSKQNIDSISMTLIKENSMKLSEIFCDIINLCFSHGKFPKVFKQATVVPIFKKGERTELPNYRPISLLQIFSKILEKCIHSRVMNFMVEKRVISPKQFGFQKGLSTENAIRSFCEFIYDALNRKNFTISIFVDLQKAYETINRDILLNKLKYYGIRGIPLALFTDYLATRTQVVRLGNCFSQSREIATGLLTGSVLSCILFLLYINDLPLISPSITPFLFADDTTLSFSGSSIYELTQVCNIELNNFLTWTQANRLSINASKTYQ